ncbi:MAG: hypothetical protein AAF598_02150 [Bacteroidota bacterium]
MTTRRFASGSWWTCRFRDGCLNQRWFRSLEDAREIIEAFEDYLSDTFSNDYDNDADVAIRALISEFNSAFPDNGQGIRTITTHLVNFVDTEVEIESLKKADSKTVKYVTNGTFETYKQFIRYAKIAAFFIKKLTPFANPDHKLDVDDYLDKDDDQLIAFFEERIGYLNRLLLKLEQVYDQI